MSQKFTLQTACTLHIVPSMDIGHYILYYTICCLQGRANIAKCVASLVRRNPGGQAVAVVQRFLDNLAGQPDHARTFSLLAVGEIGRQGYTIYFYQLQLINPNTVPDMQ